jgi:hypothetical protein
VRVVAGYAAPFYFNPVPALFHGLVKGSVLVVDRDSLGLLMGGTHDKHNEHDSNRCNGIGLLMLGTVTDLLGGVMAVSEECPYNSMKKSFEMSDHRPG